ncbi:MAG: hypothetical protein KatS3mg102_2539 [Planctomycetota bacterium]|nr:MAG: hypothetical protein KatS3mg102_2539 [Planctomycetota bacterium]
MELLRRTLAGAELGRAALEVTELNDGPPVGRPVTVRVQHDELEVLATLAERVAAEVRATRGVRDVASSLEPGAAEAAIQLDEELAALHGVSARAVATVLAVANEGLLAGRLRGPDEDWKVRVRLVPGARRTLADLEAVQAAQRRRSAGAGACGRADCFRGPLSPPFERWQGRRIAFVTAEIDPALTTALEANRSLRERLAPLLERYPGASLSFTGEFEETPALVPLARRGIGDRPARHLRASWARSSAATCSR